MDRKHRQTCVDCPHQDQQALDRGTEFTGCALLQRRVKISEPECTAEDWQDNTVGCMQRLVSGCSCGKNQCRLRARRGAAL